MVLPISKLCKKKVKSESAEGGKNMSSVEMVFLVIEGICEGRKGCYIAF